MPLINASGSIQVWYLGLKIVRSVYPVKFRGIAGYRMSNETACQSIEAQAEIS